MSGPWIPEVGDALAKLIRETDLGLRPDRVQRSWAQWKDELATIGGLVVDVVPVTTPQPEEQGLSHREAVQFTFQFDIVMRRKFRKEDRDAEGQIPNDKIDPHANYVRDILLLLPKRELPDCSGIAFFEQRLRILGSQRHLREMGQFTAVVRVTYQREEDLS